MVTIAYLVFLLLSAPVASVSAPFAVSDGERVSNIDSVELSEGGFVAVYDDSSGDGIDGQLLGHTGYLPPGTHNNLIIPLTDGEITETTDVRIVVHRDTDGDGRFGYTPPFRAGTGQIDRPYEPLSDGALPGVTVEVEYLGGGSGEQSLAVVEQRSAAGVPVGTGQATS